MVGVPGRSKACHTCIARKKGCDRKVPSCSQCIAAALVCGGYVREYTWVDVQRKPRPSVATHSKSKDPDDHQNLAKTHGGTAGAIVLHDSLVISARDTNLLGSYWESFLPNGRPMTLKASSLSAGGWFAFLGNMHQAEPTLRYAMYAISCTMLGVRDGNEQMRMKGLQTYVLSLEELAKALKDPRRAVSDGLLAAIRVLGSYQVLFGRDTQDHENAAKKAQIEGWNGHTDGELALAKLRGPNGFSTSAGHQLLVDGMMNAITNCMSRRKRTMFEDIRWRTDPWIGRSRTLKDKLLDIVVDIPGYMEDFDNINAFTNRGQGLEARVDLLARCCKTDRNRLDWEMEASSKIQRFDYTVTGLPVPELAKSEDLSVLSLSCFYWAMCIPLHCIIRDLMFEDTFISNRGEKLATGFSHIDPERYAHKIARCVHLHFDPQAGGLGANLGIMPLAVAWFYLDSIMTNSEMESEELGLLNKLFKTQSTELYVSRFLDSLRGVIVQPF